MWCPQRVAVHLVRRAPEFLRAESRAESLPAAALEVTAGDTCTIVCSVPDLLVVYILFICLSLYPVGSAPCAARQESMLKRAGITRAALFYAATGDDAENMCLAYVILVLL